MNDVTAYFACIALCALAAAGAVAYDTHTKSECRIEAIKAHLPTDQIKEIC